jgi:hypothetical protein
MEKEQKVCNRCNKLKKLTDFFKSKNTKSGLLGNCKECTKRPPKNINVFGVNNRIKTHLLSPLEIKETSESYIVFKNNKDFNKILINVIDDIKSQTTFQFKTASLDYNEEEIKCYKTSFYSSIDCNYKEHFDQNEITTPGNIVLAALLVSYCSTKKKILINLLAIKEI